MKKSQSAVSFANENYDSDEAFLDSGSDGEVAVQASSSSENASNLIVERILGRKFLPNEEGILVEMFYIKWKGMSYLHASWERPEDIEMVDPGAKIKLKRFMQTPQPAGILGESPTPPSQNGSNGENGNEEGDSTSPEDEEIEYFNPDMVEVQRIIACDTITTAHAKARSPSDLMKPKNIRKRKLGSNDSLSEMEVDSENDVKYLVKWKGLPYDECTWEKWEELKPWYREVWLFWYLQRPQRSPSTERSYPTLQDYKKLDVSPMFGVSKVLPPEEDMEPGGGLQLRDYQLEGVNWLLWNWWHKRPCILADEMGLGKTIQTVSFLHQLRYMSTTNISGPFLIIAPLSLVDQWLSEISTWSPDMNCVLLHGNVNARETIRNYEFYYSEPYINRSEATALRKEGITKFHILLTTFEVAVKEIREITRIPWEVMIIDEAHKLKNPSSRLFTTLSSIDAHHCLLLTGTPLQNKTEELWSLLNFADRKRFADLTDFVHKFGDLKDSKQVAMLYEVLRPYLLRRIKEDVEKSLPPKEETIVEVSLTAVQKRYYRAIFEKNTLYLFRGLKASNQPSLMNVMMELRKCCNHPYLVRGVEERILSELTPEEKADDNILHKKLIECSGKLVLLDKGYLYERLDGTSKSADRKEAVERFCKPSMNRFIMLLSTKAGGLGLNLTAADTVIIYDSDWNPQNDLQAQARAHRIGQTKAVMVYRLLTRKTYEMQMFHQASMKLGLDRAVLAHARIEQEEEGRHNKKGGSLPMDGVNKLNLGVKEIDELLKRGAYDVFREDDTEQTEFVEADIDAILQRSAHKVVYDSSLGSVANSLGNFSKASFVSADEKEDVDINDPDFWRKAVGLKEDTRSILDDPEVIEELPQQRVRKQTKVYGGVQSADEEQLKEFLKPIKTDKTEKRTMKALQKEAALKEKMEREEARRQKQQEEARMKGDPRNWGSHGRDRVLRCLNMYGFGRWERIKAETGKGMMDARDLEAFSRAYVLQCGLCASVQETNKVDSPFVREAIRAAKELRALEQAGEKDLDIPPSLQDEKFLAKLKQGQARKILNKLDALAKLVNMVRAAVEEAYNRKDIEYDPSLDLDLLTATVTPQELSDCLALGDVRPPWTRSCTWWNLTCDRQLIIGVFKHGFGRYDLIREDDSLIFKSLLAKQGAEGGGEVSQVRAGADPSQDNHDTEMNVDTKEEIIDFVDQDKMEENDMDVDDEGMPGLKGDMHNSSSGGWPDPRHLNRLVTWLVTSEAAKMTKAEYIESQKRERKNAKASNVEMNTKKDNKFSNLDFDDSQISSQQASLLRTLLDSIDFDSVALVYKNQILGLKKCEYILSLPLNYEEIDAANREEKLSSAMECDTDRCDSPARDSVQQSMTSDMVEMSRDNGDNSNSERPDGPPSVVATSVTEESAITEFEAIRLSATLILFGAPLQNFVDGDSQAGERHSESALYSWAKVREYSQVRLSEDQLRSFYHSVWLPFCEQVSVRKNLSYSQHKYLVPNPLLSTAEHHYAARGLCQIFVIRQQLLCSAHFVMSNCYDSLQEYLRSPQGRNVDFMPVWWCPWIHDLGLLLGLIKYGFLALRQIIADPDLPFNENYLRKFVTNLFLSPPDPNNSLGKYDIHSKNEAQQFLKIALLQFPDAKDLELRIMRILEDMTKMLPMEHLCKVTIGQNYRSLVLQLSAGTENNETDKKNTDQGKGKGDSKSNRSTARPPAVSLKTFIASSRKRRKMYVTSYHPDCFIGNFSVNSITYTNT
eukprot:scaffold598_cov183-Ochromonas_danica.AAC.8